MSSISKRKEEKKINPVKILLTIQYDISYFPLEPSSNQLFVDEFLLPSLSYRPAKRISVFQWYTDACRGISKEKRPFILLNTLGKSQ